MGHRDADDGRAVPHALAIGASGMLAGAVREIAGRGYVVTLVARDTDRIARVAAGAGPGAVHPVSVDYRHGDVLLDRLRGAARERGAFRLAVAWIHATAPDAHDLVAGEIGSSPPTCRYLEVVGSAGGDLRNLARERAARLAALPHLDHTRVVLGYGGDGERWLTDREISRGVIDALDAGGAEHVVGTLDPRR